jgi:plastocyanin
MDLKQWMGAAGAGIGAIALSFFLNRPTNILEQPGVRALSAELSVEAKPEVKVPAPEIKVPAPAPKAAPATKPAPKPVAPKAEEPKAAPTKATPAAVSTPSTPRAAGEKGVAVKGTVTWKGDPAKNAKIEMDSDPVCKELCAGKDKFKETYVIADGKLANVCVYVSKGLPADGKFPARTDTVVINQIGCTYVPHVVAMQLGQKVEIQNSDATTHNVHFKSKLNGDWNMTQSEKGTVDPKEPFKRAELGTASFKCDIHTWMESRALIFDHPFFAVTGADGTFEIKDLPPGSYTLTAWHEKEKAQTMDITVTADATATADFTFSKGGK